VSERVWADVRVAARVARAEGVALRVHGIEVLPYTLKQHFKAPSHQVSKPKAETVEGAQPAVARDEASQRPPSKRQQRQARRLEEFHKQKREAAVAAKVAAGVEAAVAEQQVAREEQRRLESIAARKAASAGAESAPELLPAAPSGAAQMEVCGVMQCHHLRPPLGLINGSRAAGDALATRELGCARGRGEGRCARDARATQQR